MLSNAPSMERGQKLSFMPLQMLFPHFEVEVEDEEKNLKAMEWVGPPDWAAVKKMQGW